MTYLSDLPARPCRVCGAETGSPVLDTCEAHDDAQTFEYDPVTASPAEDDDARARDAISYMHALAVDSHARARMEAHDAR